ncbi:MAG: HAD family phosphatase [Bryobacterales bacterium]|nr:HAD family phosphatase [Bryobacterales bacterium]
MKNYRALIFDLGGVILGLDFARGYRRMSELCGMAPQDIPKHIGATGLVPKFECGTIAAGEFVEKLTHVFDGKVSGEQFVEIWGSIFEPRTLLPESLFEELKRSYRLVLLSNTNSLHFEMIEQRYPLLRHFDAQVLSYRVGAAKPDARIYRAAVDAAGCDAAECFFTDDALPYVEGARAAGIDGEQFTSFEALTNVFDSRGIRWRE